MKETWLGRFLVGKEFDMQGWRADCITRSHVGNQSLGNKDNQRLRDLAYPGQPL